MSQDTVSKIVKRLGSLILLVVGVSAFGDERPQEGTAIVGGSAEVRVDAPVKVRNGAELEGTVIRVGRHGDYFQLRSGRDRVTVHANRGVKAWYRGTAYRVRDLEPGDEVIVKLKGSRDRYRAKRVDVIRSVSHDYHRSRRGYGYDDDWRYADGRYGYDDRRERFRDDLLAGHLDYLDLRRGYLELRVDFFRTIRVDLGDLSRSELRRLRRATRGDRIVLEGYFHDGLFYARELEDVRRR